MTTDVCPALQLRLAIGDVYLASKPPPGRERATWFTAALRREPDRVEFHQMARDFLVVVDLYRRLALMLAETEDAQLGLIVHGLIGHAKAELMGATRDPGWRAVALDVLDPDGDIRPPLHEVDTARLFQLAIGLIPGPLYALD